MEVMIVSSVSGDNPLGVRGAGEAGLPAVAAAVASAIETAIGCGLVIDSTPIRPTSVWELAHASSGEGSARSGEVPG